MVAHRRVIGLVALGAALMLAPPASAQNIFQSLFGGIFHHRETSAPARSFDPFSAFARAVSPPSSREDHGPGTAFCVRTCDGFHFLVHANPGASAAQMCHAFCPAGETRLYSGGNIDTATASDGGRYADLDTAYAYRKQLVAGCTCNGRDVFGLAHIDAASDPTLRPGDVVATRDGLMAFTGGKATSEDKAANFTPIDSYAGWSRNARDKLSEMKVAPPGPGAADAGVTAPVQQTRDSRNAEK